MKKYLISILLPLLFSSCIFIEFPDTHRVDAELDVYAQRFFTEAKKYGHNFDDEGLIMTFARLDGDKAGVCYMNRRPIEIEIDPDYWASISESYLADDAKEDLVFHEMGHGFLQRYHINDVLKNKDWKSIMCGDELPNGRASNINYRGMRKDYYIKELFTQTREVPSWSTFVPDFSGMFENKIFSLSKTRPQLPIVNQENFYSRVENGEYVATSYSSNVTANVSASVNTLDDFCIEVSLKIVSNNKSDMANSGIYFGQADAKKENHNLHYITIDEGKHIFLGENASMIPFIDLYREEFKPNDYNKIKIYKQGQFIYYFLNDTFIYHNDIADLRQGGDNIGLIIYAGNTVYIRDFNIYLDKSNNRNLKQITPEIREVEIYNLKRR